MKKITKELLLTLSREEIIKKILPKKTRIFKSYEEFLDRSDKSINGVSIEFAIDNPEWEEMNITNTGCWNCYLCFDCYFCDSCKYCTYCRDCTLCVYCFSCVSSESCAYNKSLTVKSHQSGEFNQHLICNLSLSKEEYEQIMLKLR